MLTFFLMESVHPSLGPTVAHLLSDRSLYGQLWSPVAAAWAFMADPEAATVDVLVQFKAQQAILSFTITMIMLC